MSELMEKVWEAYWEEGGGTEAALKRVVDVVQKWPAASSTGDGMTEEHNPSPQTHVTALEKEIKDLKHNLASAEGRAKNATSNCDYWKAQYEAATNSATPQPNVALADKLEEEVRRLDDTPPSLQTQANIRLIDAVREAAAILRGTPSPQPKTNGNPINPT